MISKAFRQTRADLVWLLVIALIGNSLFPLAAMATRSGLPERVLLCTSTGYQWISVRDQAPSTSKASHCVLCLLQDHPADVALGGPIEHNIWQQHSPVNRPTKNQLVSRKLVGLPQVRAPPLSL